MLQIAVLVSGGGTNLQAIIDAISTQELPAQITSVIADRECYGLTRAATAGISTHLVDRKIAKSNLSREINALIPYSCDLIVLAGFLSILDSEFINNWQGKIINIHPSLLPKHGGAGMWGMNVHKAVVAAGDIQSGCTVHYVTEEIDGGDIILQTIVDVFPSDTPEDVQKRVLVVEHGTLVNAIKGVGVKLMVEQFINGKYPTDTNNLESIKNFALVWNVFEYSCCSTHGSIRNSPNMILRNLEGKFNAPEELCQLNNSWIYFQRRYITDNQTNAFFNNDLFNIPVSSTSSECDKFKEEIARQKEAKSILENYDPTIEEKIKCLLLISFRVRNNFFHGSKQPNVAINQGDLFLELSKFLILIISKY